jgi:knotted carbamoyltransferase YgeW
MNELGEAVSEIRRLKNGLCGKDFLLTWEKSVDELKVTLKIAEAMQALYHAGLSCRLFDTGLAVSQFRDQSTRTRFSFASAANLLGLAVQDLDEGKSQIAHGETVRETATMISYLTEVIGIRDDLYLGAGHNYMIEVGNALEDGFAHGVLPRRPLMVNLQSDLDHPTQSLADLFHLANHFKGLDNLKGKKMAMSWAYSPSYGKPLSVPQGIIGLMTRFGMNVVLAHPEGYNLVPEVLNLAQAQASQCGGSLEVIGSMDEAFYAADVVYPKSWAPYRIMQQRAERMKRNDNTGLRDLEAEGLDINARYKDWECTEKRMNLTREGRALYMHCLPADISGVSCVQGEVQESVFERYRMETYREAGYKPYIIAAMILAGKFADPASVLEVLAAKAGRRIRM